MMVTSLGPHHCFICSTSVKHFHTSSPGSLNTREMTNSCLFSAATFFLLGLDFLQIILEPVEAFFPKTAVVFDPVGGIFQRGSFEAGRAPLRLAAAGDQAGAFQRL